MNFAVEAEAPLVVMVLVELLAIVFPTWVILAFIYRERECDQIGRNEEEVQGRLDSFQQVNVLLPELFRVVCTDSLALG